MHVLVLTPAKAVETALNVLLQHGDVTSPRGMKTREVLNVTLEVSQPWQLPLRLDNRGLNQAIGAAEAAQLIGQISVPEKMTMISRAFAEFMDDGLFHGAYGPRISGGPAKIVRLLKDDPDSRQAVLTIHDQHRDLCSGARDIPCTLTLQYFVRHGQLYARTSMRSNDAWLGLPYDLTQFCSLQGAIAAALDLPMGRYTHTVGSLHLYEQHWEKARTVKSLDNDLTPYQPLFSCGIDESSRFCRAAMYGAMLIPDTAFEGFLLRELS